LPDSVTLRNQVVNTCNADLRESDASHAWISADFGGVSFQAWTPITVVISTGRLAALQMQELL
jgi:hypothetical protein